MHLRGRVYVRQPIFVLLGAVALSSLFGLPVLRHAPNRLLSGSPLWSDALGSATLLIAGSGCVLLLAGLLPRGRIAACAALAASWAIPILFIVAAGQAARNIAAGSGETARTSIAVGGWILIVTGLLALAEAVRLADPPPLARLAIFLAVAVGFGFPAWAGWLDDIALLKEWQAKQDVFAIAIWQHGAIVFGTLVPTLLIGLPLGFIAYWKRSIRGPLLSTLGLIQTIPSIALFGLLMVPLTALGDAFPLIRTFGIRGVGAAPAIIALTLYALLPVVRNTLSGLEGVPANVLDAARGQGLTSAQIFLQVELPLAAPVILSGLRITIVQTIGLAAVAALIGAGGLGALMFQGLFANAADLILLGAIPIVVIAVVVDLGFRLLVRGRQEMSA